VTNPVLPLQDDSTLLSVYIEIDTTEIAPLDTVLKKQFYYDNAKRNIAIDYTFYAFGINYLYKSFFFYKGDDRLPFKRIEITPFVSAPDLHFKNDTSFYFYANSILISDSNIHAANYLYTLVNNYRYNTAGIINTSINYAFNSNSSSAQTDTIYLQHVNGNITNQVNNPATGDKQILEYVYDDHPNPFHKTAPSRSLSILFPGNFFRRSF
jgi:hypothetical protein